MSFENCCTCGKPYNGETIWTDGGFMEVNHGGGQCKECYLADGHKICSSCNEVGKSDWIVCPHCATPYK